MLQRIRLGNITYTIGTFLHKNPADIFISHKSKYTNLKAKISELCKDYLYYHRPRVSDGSVLTIKLGFSVLASSIEKWVKNPNFAS